MNKLFWTLPGPASFLDALEGDLRACRSVILRWPAHGPAGLREALADRVRVGDSLVWRRVGLAEGGDGPAAAGRSPLEFLCLLFLSGDGLPPGARPGVRALAECRRLRGYVVWVEDANGSAGRKDWGRFLLEYEAASRAYGSGEAACFVVPFVASPDPGPSEDAVALVTRRWRGVVSLEDMTLFAFHLLRDKPLRPLYRRLAAHVIAELAGSDPALAHELAALPLPALLRPTDALADFARRRGWTVELLGKATECSARAHGAPRSEGPWADGIEDDVDGRRLLHSAAAAVVGRHEDVDRRIWRAQVAVLFPFIEEHRAALVRDLDNHLRVPIETPFGIISDKRDLEIGQILHQLTRVPVPTRLLDFVRSLTSMRHALAHLEIVSNDDLLAPEVQRHADLC